MQTQNQTSEHSSKSHTLAGLRFWDIIQTLGVAIAVALFLKIFIIELYQVPSRSMEQKLLAGDYVVADKIAYSIGLPTVLPFTNIRLPFAEWRIMFKNIHRSDVIIFDFPGEISEIIPQNPELYVKRVVGLPGETVSVSNGKIFINGLQMIDDYCDGTIIPQQASGAEDCPFLGPLTVPKKGMKITLTPEYIDLYQTLIEREGNSVEIVNNRVYINGDETTSYIVHDNYYYVLGDNCSDSYDSRYWGFVPERSIMGKPLMIYWSVDAVSKSARWNRIGTIVQ